MFDATSEADEIEKLVQPMLDRGADRDKIAAALLVLAGALAAKSRRRQMFVDTLRGEAAKLAKAP